jgi:hypothetical protein
MIVMMVAPPIEHKVIVVTAGMKSACLRLLHQGGAYRKRALKNLRLVMTLLCYTINSFVKSSGDGDVESLLSLTPFMPLVVSFVSVMSL